MRLQSATEFLITYSWAVLVVAIILVVIYSIGAFNGPSALANVCIPTPGFSCNNPVLYSTGTLVVNLSIYKTFSNSIAVTELACTKDAVTPLSQSFVHPPEGNSVIVTSRNPQQFYFTCPLPSNEIGSVFSGYLWIVYNASNAQNLAAEFASVTAKVSGTMPPPITVGSTTSSSIPTTSSTVTTTQSTSIQTTSSTTILSISTTIAATTLPTSSIYYYYYSNYTGAYSPSASTGVLGSFVNLLRKLLGFG